MGICQYAVRGVYILYANRELGLDALQIGLVLAVGGLAAAPGGLLADRVAAQAIGGLAATVANVNQWSLRQRVTPDHLRGRVTASHRFLVYGAFPIGALLGGLLVTQIGMRPARRTRRHALSALAPAHATQNERSRQFSCHAQVISRTLIRR